MPSALLKRRFAQLPCRSPNRVKLRQSGMFASSPHSPGTLITDIVAWASRSLAGGPSNRPCFSSDETRGAHSHFPFVPVGPRLSLLAAAVALQPQAVAAESASQQAAALPAQE